MNINFHRIAKKEFDKLSKKDKVAVFEALKLLIKTPFHPKLSNHELKGKYIPYRSINAKGDLRVIYTQKGNTITVKHVGTHSQLYG